MNRYLFIILLLLSAAMLLADTMPDFKLPDINNKEVKLSQLLNKGPIIIDFWATWCVPCKKAMTALNKLAEKYDSLTVVAISIDAPKDVPKAKNMLKSNGYKFVSLFDTEKKLARKLNVINPPYTIILDSNGEIVLMHEGYETGTENKYEEKIRELLKLETITNEESEEVVEEKNESCH